jgi:hypothetical protein
MSPQRVLDISPELRSALVQIRRQRGINVVAEAFLEDLRAAETAIGGRVPDELLAYWLGTQGPTLGELVRMTAGVRTFYRTSYGRVPKFPFVVFDEGGGDGESVYCTPLLDAGERNAIFLWPLRKAEAWTPAFATADESPFVSYCHARFAFTGKAEHFGFDGSPTPTVDFSRPVSDAELDAFQPRIVTAKASPAPRKVRHRIFGEGIVIKTMEPDKIEVDFGPAGTKKLLKTSVDEIA